MGNIDSQDKEVKPQNNPALTQTMSQSVKPNFTNQNLPQAQQQVHPQQAQLNELANFQHPHLVTQFDIQSRNLTTLEQIVSERLNSNKLFPEDDLMALLQGVLSALAFLQETGKGHGDIHPSTIYFDQVSGTFKINEREPYYGRGAGYTQALQRIKFSYLSPELISSMRQQKFDVGNEVFYNSDIFAFGMVLLETATLKRSTECYDQHYTIMGNIVMDRINFLSEYYSQSFCSLLQVMLDFETRPSALQLWQNIINLLQQLDQNEQKLVQQQQAQVQQRLVDDYYSQQRQPQSQYQPQLQPQYPPQPQNQVQPQPQHQQIAQNYTNQQQYSNSQQQYQNQQHQFSLQIDQPPQPNPKQRQQQQYSQQVQVQEPFYRNGPQQEDYTALQQQQYQYQQPKPQQQQRLPQEEQYQYKKKQQPHELQPQHLRPNYQYTEQQQVYQAINPNCQTPLPPQQQQQLPQYVQQPQQYEREVKEVRYAQQPQYQEVECQQVPPQYQYHGKKVEIIQEQLQHGGYQKVSPSKSFNNHQHVSPSNQQYQQRQQVQYKQLEQENMYAQRTQQVSDVNGRYVLSSQGQNIERQSYKPKESQNNIENLKQEIEKSKKLIENYQKKASDTKSQQYQVIVTKPQDSSNKKVVQEDTCVSSNLDDRIKQVIARSQAIRENFH